MSKHSDSEFHSIGIIGNYYGGLCVKKEYGKFYWSIENYSGNNWEQIPEYLYIALLKFESEGESP